MRREKEKIPTTAVIYILGGTFSMLLLLLAEVVFLTKGILILAGLIVGVGGIIKGVAVTEHHRQNQIESGSGSHH